MKNLHGRPTQAASSLKCHKKSDVYLKVRVRSSQSLLAWWLQDNSAGSPALCPCGLFSLSECTLRLKSPGRCSLQPSAVSSGLLAAFWGPYRAHLVDNTPKLGISVYRRRKNRKAGQHSGDVGGCGSQFHGAVEAKFPSWGAIAC